MNAWDEAERGEDIVIEEPITDAMDGDTEEAEGEEEISRDDPIEDPPVDEAPVEQKQSDTAINNHELVSTLDGSVETMKMGYKPNRASNGRL